MTMGILEALQERIEVLERRVDQLSAKPLQTIPYEFSHPVSRAAALVGSKTELARRLNVTKSMVSQMCSAVIQVPAAIAIAIERETAGAVTVEELRPDIDWQVIRGLPQDKRVAA